MNKLLSVIKEITWLIGFIAVMMGALALAGLVTWVVIEIFS